MVKKAPSPAPRTKRRINRAFARYITGLKLSKGKDCGKNGRKRILRAIKAGSDPQAAVDTYCKV